MIHDWMLLSIRMLEAQTMPNFMGDDSPKLFWRLDLVHHNDEITITLDRHIMPQDSLLDPGSGLNTYDQRVHLK